MNDKVKKLLIEIKNNDFTVEEIENLLSSLLKLGKWEDVRDAILNILYQNEKDLWDEAAILIYYLINRNFYFEDIKTIALLHDCLLHSSTMDENLIWTITKTIKSLPYLSDYDPFNDALILNEMERIKEIRIKNNFSF